MVPGLLERLEPVVELPRLLVVLLNIGYAQYRVGNCTVAESTLLRAIEAAQHFEMGLCGDARCSVTRQNALEYWTNRSKRKVASTLH